MKVYHPSLLLQSYQNLVIYFIYLLAILFLRYDYIEVYHDAKMRAK